LAAVEDGSPWSVRNDIELDQQCPDERACGRLPQRGENRVTVEVDGKAHWRVDGFAARTGRLPRRRSRGLGVYEHDPIHRLGFEAGDSADAPAAYVRWLDLSVQRLEQEYHRLDDDKRRLRFDDRAPRFDNAARLVFDRSGLVLSYPNIASRAARSTAALTFAGADIRGLGSRHNGG
jgi:hypothetical protein